jgi:hypothetical protein
MKLSKINNLWPYIFLTLTLILLYNVFRYKCNYTEFESIEYSVCGKIDIGKIYIIILIVSLAASLFFSFKKISCSFKIYNNQKNIVCGTSERNTVSIIILALSFIFLLFSFVIYYFNISMCSKSYDEFKKIKLMQLKNFVENSYVNSEYYPNYFGEKKYPDSFDDMIINGTISEEEAKYFQESGFDIKKTDGDDKYYIEAKMLVKEKRYPCEDIIKISNVYFCNQDDCVLK